MGFSRIIQLAIDLMMKIFNRIYVFSAIMNLVHFKSFSKRCYFGKNVRLEGNVTYGCKISFDDNVDIRSGKGSDSFIGNNVSINKNTVIRGRFRIGNDCAIAPNCTIIGANHSFQRVDIPIKQQGFSCRGGVIIEDDVWIGANSVVLDGVTIGRGCVIGAGSIVTKSVPPYSIAVGNPCRVIKSRK